MCLALIRQAQRGHKLINNNQLALTHKKLVTTAALFHIGRQEGWLDVAPTNSVRSERKQPQ